MADFKSKYTAKTVDSKGYVNYSDEENAVWRYLYERQMKIMPSYACQEHIDGLSCLQLSPDNIPQLPEVNQQMIKATGWSVVPVGALITPKMFFDLLAHRQFPAATFIRSRAEIDYVTEPDIFHEVFGHSPMLTEPVFADFVQHYASMTLKLEKKYWPLMQRLFWFTVEFGLIKTSAGLRIYGGGILSSFKETTYSIDSDVPLLKPYSPLEALRTPYRIDQLQTIYFVLEEYSQLFHLVDNIEGVKDLLVQAHQLGEYPPTFKVSKDNPAIHINAC